MFPDVVSKTESLRCAANQPGREPTVLCLYVRHDLTDLTLFATCDALKRRMVSRIGFGNASTWRGRSAEPVSSGYLASYGERLSLFLDGTRQALNDIAIDTSRFTPFQRAVLAAAQRIPWGATVSYAELASLAGHPTAVRASASVMRNNDFPLVVPCHRVVRTNGTIGGFMGKNRGRSIELKRRLLAHEGVELR